VWQTLLGLFVLIILAGLGWLYQGTLKEMFTPAATPLPPPPGAANGILYQTNFDDPAAIAADWQVFEDGLISGKLKDSQLVVGVNAQDDTAAWSGLNYSFENFVLDVDATKLDGPDDNGIIVIFRLADQKNYNRFDISSDGYYAVSKARDGVLSRVSDFGLSPAIYTGSTPNHIRITAVGNTFHFEVNGTALPLCISNDPAVKPLWDPAATTPTCLGGSLADSWENADLPQGQIGLGAQGYVGFDGTNATPALAVIGFDSLSVAVAP
jgi:hypothetical protein